jgi:hypothetical protein
VRVEPGAFGVDNPEVHVAEPQLGPAAAGHRQHGRREVGADQAAGLASDRGRFEAGIARPRRQLQERVAGLRPKLADHPLAHRGHGLLQARPPPLPARRGRLTDLVAGVAEFLDRVACHSASCFADLHAG